jgi:HPt (histidine-containing phosphotransfer) domain-containing protein
MAVFMANPIPGMDFADAINRMGNKPSIYLRVIKSFIASTPEVLDILAQVTLSDLADYAVRIHGIKGSLYGIGAMTAGDEARALEFAAKAANWLIVERDNPTAIAHINQLIKQLRALVQLIDGADKADSDPRPLVAAPDAAVLERLAEASYNFEIELMEQAIDELDGFRYRSDPELVKRLRTQLTDFRYDLVENEARAALASLDIS